MSAQFKVANRTVIRAYQDLIHQSLIVKVGKSFFAGNFTALSKAGSGRLVYWFACDADALEQMFTGNPSGLAFRRMWQELGDHGYRLCVTPLDRAPDLERQWQRDSAWPDAVVFHGAGEPAFPVIQKLHRRSTRLRQNAKMPIVVDLLWGSYRQLPAGIPVFHRGNVETTLSRAAAQFIAHQNHSPVSLLFDAAGLHTVSIFLLVKTAVELRSFDADCLPHLFVFNAPVPDADAFIDTMHESVAQPRLDAILTKEHTLSLEELRKELRFAQTTQHPPRDLPPGFWLCNSERLAACARQWAGIRGWNTPQRVAILSFEDGLTSARADISSCTLDWNSTGFRLAHAVINDFPTPRSSRGFIRPQTRIVERGTT